MDSYMCKRLNMLLHFQKVKWLNNKVKQLAVQGPFVIGIGKPGIEKENEMQYKIDYVYDYEEEQKANWDFRDIFEDHERRMNSLSEYVFVQPLLS